MIGVGHYQDVIEERSISSLCGYPLCSNSLGKVKSNKYHISTKDNMVYDVTKRKKFCSGGCYHSSQHLLQQLTDTPIWAREKGSTVSVNFVRHRDKLALVGEAVISYRPTAFTDCKAFPRDSSRTSGQSSLNEGKSVEHALTAFGDQEDIINEAKSLELDDEDTRPLDKGHEDMISSVTAMCLSTNDQKLIDYCRHPGYEDVEYAHVLPMRKKFSHDSVMKTGSTDDGDIHQKKMSTLAALDSDDDDDDSCKDDFESVDDIGCISDDVATEESRAGFTDERGPSLTLPSNNESERCNEALNIDVSISTDVACICLDRCAGGDEAAGSLAHCAPINDEQLGIKAQGLLHVEDSHPFITSYCLSGDSSFTQDCSAHSDDASIRTKHCTADTGDGKVFNGGNRASRPLSRTGEQMDCDKDLSNIAQLDCVDLPAKTSTSSLVDTVKHRVSQWITLRTFAFLGLDINTGKEGNCVKGYLVEQDVDKDGQFMCMKLKEDEKGNQDIVSSDSTHLLEVNDARKLLSIREIMRHQTMEYEQNVRAFFQSPVEKKIDEVLKDKSLDKDESKLNIILPVVDSHNLMSIRRRIVLEHLDRSMSNLLPIMGLSIQVVSSGVRLLLFSFTLAVKSQKVASVFHEESMTEEFRRELSQLGCSLNDLHNIVHGSILQTTTICTT